MSSRSGEKPGKEGPWTKIIAGGTVILVVLALIGLVVSSGGSSPRPPTSTRRPTSTPRPTSSPTPTRLSQPVYLDTIPQTGGGTVTPGEVSISGRKYKHGLQFEVGVGVNVEADYSIPSNANTFSAVIGNDDNQTNSVWEEIPLLYEVLVDQRRVASGHAKAHLHDQPLHAEVTGHSTLTLKVTDVGGELGSTKADWGDPAFR